MAEQFVVTPGMNPLTEDHYKQLKQGLVAADEGLRQVDLAARAGIDLSDQKAQLEKDRSQIQRLLQVYFPGL